MPAPVRLQPLPAHVVEQARACGWAVVPLFWMERRLDEIGKLRRQLDDARAANAASPPGRHPGPDPHPDNGGDPTP
jgi:hypothetical protein